MIVMKAELLKTMSLEQLNEARKSYLGLWSLYEQICGGPYAARQYKEYFAICDNIALIDRELNERHLEEYGRNY